MASYGFITTASANRNSDGSRAAGDPYAGTRVSSPSGGGGLYDRPSPGAAAGDPYAGTQGSSQQQIPLNFASVSPYAGTSSAGGNSVFQSYQPQNYVTPSPGAQGAYDPGFNGPQPQNWAAGRDGQGSATSMYKPTPAPAYQQVGNVGLPTGYDNNVAAYNDPDYRNAMAAWAQTGLPAQQAINNQQNADREYAFNSWLQQNQLGQTQWRDQQANDLAWSGLTLQQQLAQDSANQWGAQFGYQQERDVRNDWVNDRDYQASIVQANRDYEQSGQRIDIDSARQQADAAYQQGTLDINRYNAEMNRLKQVEDNALSTLIANREYEQSGQRIEIDRAKQQADAAYQQGTLSINQYRAEMDRLGQIENNARQTAKDRADAAYQQGSLQQQRYSTDIGAQISREQLAQQRYSTDIGAQVSREQMQRAYDTAVMQAVGRNQAQNVRWMRG